jgi:hypothetical protein
MPIVPLTTGRIYRAFDSIVRRTEGYVASSNVHAVGCDPAAVRARIAQRMVEITSDAFTRLSVAQETTDLGRVNLNGLRTDPETGRISPTVRLAVRCLLEFAVSWWRFTRAVAAECLRSWPRGQARTATVLLGAPSPDQDDTRFVRFCCEGPVEPLKQAEWLVVETPRAPAIAGDRKIGYSPAAVAHVCGALPWSQRVQVLARHASAPFLLAATMIRSPLTVLLARDFALIPAVTWLGRSGMLSDIVITTSAFTAQPLWMHGVRDRRHTLHMVWYSQNFVPKQYVGESVGSDLPAARHMRVDQHWVWTAGFAGYLRELDQDGAIRIVGPLLWYLPEDVSPRRKDDAIHVAVFDVTPFDSSYSAFGAARNYYSAITIGQFTTDIVTACEALAARTGRRVVMLVKHKRDVSLLHDRGYLDMLDSLASERNDFVLVDHRADLFSLLSTCEVSVSVPYTSTAYVAAHLGRPAIFYDPFGELVPDFERDECVTFCAGRIDLQESLSRLIARRRTDGAVASA